MSDEVEPVEHAPQPAMVRYRVRSVHEGGLRHGAETEVVIELPIDEQPPDGAVRVDAEQE